MDKKLKLYEQFMNNEIYKLEKKLKSPKGESEIGLFHKNIKKISIYHNETIRNFQHERLVHLIVTLFFAGLLIIFGFAPLFITPLITDNDYTPLNALFIAINLILSTTEIFYIRHYYKLENGTQKLYELSDKLHRLSL